ncbi:MAG: CvpA family protein [Planctomycetes bacterium]|nr:CvpA family protein [Planctomycetota bacterium]
MAILQSEAAPVEFMQSMLFIDKVGLVILGVFLLRGAFQGLWWQIARLAGVVLAVIAARVTAPQWAPALQESTDLPEGAAYGLTWFSAFVLVMILAALLGRLGKKALDAMQLGMADRVGGALAGGLIGLLLHGVVLLGITGLGSTEWSTQTLAGSKSESLLNAVSNRWPLFVDASARDRIVRPLVDALGLRRAEFEEQEDRTQGGYEEGYEGTYAEDEVVEDPYEAQ